MQAWIALAAVALLCAGAFFAIPRDRHDATADADPPLATPAGITLQMRTDVRKPGVATSADWVYANTAGRTLYVYAKDVAPGKSACTAACAAAWPPAIAPPDAHPDGGWSVILRPDGARQWAHAGTALYTSTLDAAIGEARGDGADAGAWRAAVLHPGAGRVLPDGIAVRDLADAGGQGLVDASGMTLYAYDGDARHPEPACDAAAPCDRRWLPLEAPAVANGAGEFAVLAREDGVTQWAYEGRPLYRFEADQKPGDIAGAGIDARFHVALLLRYFMPPQARIRRSVELGDILVTAAGATLYQHDRVRSEETDHSFRAHRGTPATGRSLGATTCDAACARLWPPFIAPDDARPSGHWDIVRRPDGRRQWAYKGFALYTHAADGAGEIRGNWVYDLAPLGDDRADRVATGERRAPPPYSAAAGGTDSGLGLGALFWHAVVP
jgi:predicted lipoprotein with Yx(FWY)xxD motif